MTQQTFPVCRSSISRLSDDWPLKMVRESRVLLFQDASVAALSQFSARILWLYTFAHIFFYVLLWVLYLYIHAYCKQKKNTHTHLKQTKTKQYTHQTRHQNKTNPVLPELREKMLLVVLFAAFFSSFFNFECRLSLHYTRKFLLNHSKQCGIALTTL